MLIILKQTGRSKDGETERGREKGREERKRERVRGEALGVLPWLGILNQLDQLDSRSRCQSSSMHL